MLGRGLNNLAFHVWWAHALSWFTNSNTANQSALRCNVNTGCAHVLHQFLPFKLSTTILPAHLMHGLQRPQDRKPQFRKMHAQTSLLRAGEFFLRCQKRDHVKFFSSDYGRHYDRWSQRCETPFFHSSRGRYVLECASACSFTKYYRRVSKNQCGWEVLLETQARNPTFTVLTYETSTMEMSSSSLYIPSGFKQGRMLQKRASTTPWPRNCLPRVLNREVRHYPQDKKNPHGLSPKANSTDRATAACQWS
jgi:hypothetical protein